MAHEGRSTERPVARRRSRGWMWRLLVYTAALAAVLIWRMPSLRELVSTPSPPREPGTLAIAGASIAPALIGELIGEYQERYPGIRLESRPGGTTQALDELLAGRAQVAFLARPPTASERRIIRDRGDSVATYPIVLAGIAIVSDVSSSFDSLRWEELRSLLSSGPTGAGEPQRVYAPDPNRGMWDVALEKLDLPEDARSPAVKWVLDEESVVAAVSSDPESIGLGSTIALPEDMEQRSVRLVAIAGPRGGGAHRAEPQPIATGDYPLFHYLHVACHEVADQEAAGFVTYLSSGRGQRMIARRGYLPAREVARLVKLTADPIGAKRT